MFFCLDEVANIAPIHDLPALVSEAGGQGLHVMACLQDLSQARARWGEDAADGFLTLFQTKLCSPASATRTLEALSLVLGEFDRQLVSATRRSRTDRLVQPDTTTSSETVSYQTTRQRTLSPGEIAAIPAATACSSAARLGPPRATPYYATAPWSALTDHPGHRPDRVSPRYAAAIGRRGDHPAASRVVAPDRRAK